MLRRFFSDQLMKTIPMNIMPPLVSMVEAGDRVIIPSNRLMFRNDWSDKAPLTKLMLAIIPPI